MSDEDRKRLGEATTAPAKAKTEPAAPGTELDQLGGVASDARTADARPPAKRDQRVSSAPEIPGYKITSVLGEGGMGTVYAAMQDSPHRPVAIKILHRSSEAALLRFHTEAEIMARLDHPGIARILEAGEAGDHPFLAMELVEGATLDEHVAKMSRTARLELFVSICDAVHHAHIKGVIHRDLKPSNVMVRADGRAVVLDFGVARLADHASTGPTRAGELIGTPIYMSPEQARLRPDEVDARTDVYTLGVLLYELASNELPYAAPRGLPLPVLSNIICDEPPVPLSKRDPELRGDLEAIVVKALAKAPRDRYQSVAALADDVRAYLDKRPVSVRMPGVIERGRRFVRRRPVVAGAIAAATAGVIAFAAIVTVLWLDARAAHRATEQAMARTEQARVELLARNNELVLRQARAALARDPTEALAWLATLGGDDFDARIAATIADEARARGVAHDVLRGHTDEVHWVAPIKGGFVSAGYDGKVILWDPAPHVIYTIDNGRAHLAQPSPDGTHIAIGGDAGRFVIAARDGGKPMTYVPFDGEVQHVVWSPDGSLVAAATDRGQVWIIPLAINDPRQLEAGHVAVEAIAFATSGQALVTGDDDGVVRAWAMPAATPIGNRDVGASAIEVWSDGYHVRAADGDGVVHDASLAPSLPVRTADVVTGLKLKRALFDPDGNGLLAGGVGGEVLEIVGTNVKQIGLHHAQVRSVARSTKLEWFASGGDDGSLVLHHVAGPSWTLRGHAGRIRHLAFDGDVLLSADSDGVIRRWDLDALGAPPLSGAPLVSMTTSERVVGAIDETGDVFLSATEGAGYLPLGRADGRITDLALVDASGAGDPLAAVRVVTGGAHGRLSWWSFGHPEIGFDLGSPIRAIAVAPDAVFAATALGGIHVLARDGTAKVETLAGHAGGTDALAVEPGGKHIASGGQDRTIRIWRRPDAGATGYVAEGALTGIEADTHFLAYSPSGDRLVAAGNDGAVISWAVRDGKPDPSTRLVIAKHTGAVTALLVGDRAILSAGRDLAIMRVSAGTTTRTSLTSAAIQLVDASGFVLAVTRTGAVWRWDPAEKAPVLEIDHGVTAATPIPGKERWLLAFDDGAVLSASLARGNFASFRASISAATTYRLPPR